MSLFNMRWARIRPNKACTDKHNKLFSISFLISVATLTAAKGQLISKGILNSSKK